MGATATPAGATAIGGPAALAGPVAAAGAAATVVTAGGATTAGARGAEAVRRCGLALALAATVGAVAAGAPARDGVMVEVRASKRGFEPSRLTLRRGENARLVLATADVEHCFAIDALRIEKRIVPGRTTTLEIAPDRAGVFPFYCCLESGEAAATERGQLTVTE